MLWLLERGIFAENFHPLFRPALVAGHNALMIDEETLLPPIAGPVLFHGSLNMAKKIKGSKRFEPGAYCGGELGHQVCCDRLGKLMLNSDAKHTKVSYLLDNPQALAAELGVTDVFVRPDGTMKEFSGRCLNLERPKIDPSAVDLGFYYDDVDLPIVVASKKKIIQEWRFVVVGRTPATCCRYEIIDGQRTVCGVSDMSIDSGPWPFAQKAASKLGFTRDLAYVMDICETADGYRVIEFNAFSGADLYACDFDRIVKEIGAVISS